MAARAADFYHDGHTEKGAEAYRKQNETEPARRGEFDKLCEVNHEIASRGKTNYRKTRDDMQFLRRDYGSPEGSYSTMNPSFSSCLIRLALETFEYKTIFCVSISVRNFLYFLR